MSASDSIFMQKNSQVNGGGRLNPPLFVGPTAAANLNLAIPPPSPPDSSLLTRTSVLSISHTSAMIDWREKHMPSVKEKYVHS